MAGVLVVLAVLALVVLLCAAAAGSMARDYERKLAGRSLHPSVWRATIDQPRGEHVRRIGPQPYDWEQGSTSATDDERTGAD